MTTISTTQSITTMSKFIILVILLAFIIVSCNTGSASYSCNHDSTIHNQELLNDNLLMLNNKLDIILEQMGLNSTQQPIDTDRMASAADQIGCPMIGIIRWFKPVYV